MTQTLNFVAISGSLRKASTNTGLLRYAQSHLPEGVAMEILDIADIPFFNSDVAAVEMPAAVRRMVEKIRQADALVLACPEYNYTLAPALKNALDWASREPDNSALNEKPVAIMGAGGGMGSSRAQYHLRQMCVFLNLHPLNKPEVFANAFAGTFNAEGNLIDEKIGENIQKQLQALKAWTLRLAQ